MSTKLHSLSVLAGIGLAFVLTGLTSFDGGDDESHDVRISLDPDPSTIVRIEEDHPFHVPSHRILVLKTLSFAGNVNEVRLRINGALVLTSGGGAGSVPSNPLPLGFPITARAGEDVSVEHGEFSEGAAFASGYLAHD